MVSEITNPFFLEIVQTFEELAVQNDYEILLTSTVHDTKKMKSSVRRMIERRVDGVAILTFGMEEALLITGKTLVNLSTLSKLSYINLSGTKVTSSTVDPLRKMPRLQHIYLFDTPAESTSAATSKGKKIRN